MFKKLKLKLTKLLPFLRWIGRDLAKGDATTAKAKVETELDETVREIKAEIKGIK
jgi:hypothetical protein